jgi:hypothetical protein
LQSLLIIFHPLSLERRGFGIALPCEISDYLLYWSTQVPKMLRPNAQTYSWSCSAHRKQQRLVSASITGQVFTTFRTEYRVF